MADYTRREVIEVYRDLRTLWNARNAEYENARERYNGVHWDTATNPAPENRYSLTLNYLKPFVDKSVQLLVGRMPAIQVMPNGTDEGARRHAEALEGVLYGTWQANDAVDVFWKVAWDSFVLRRGLIYIWWDPKMKMVRFKSVTPDHFFPEYDGDTIWRAVYISRRNTERLKRDYPDLADKIVSDSAIDYAPTVNDETERSKVETTIYDLYENDGSWTRVMGEAVWTQKDAFPYKSVPFVDFPCYPRSGTAEPLNLIDQLVELNQYLDQLVSQKADIISRYANPTILDFSSGQSPEDIRRAVAAQGAVIPVRRDGNIALLNWQGTVPAIDEQMTFVLDAMFDLAGKPRSSFGQTVTNQSGVVTNLALTPTLQSNEAHESIWGRQLSRLNEWALMLWEKNMSGSEISFRGRYTKASGAGAFYEVNIRGADIGGWYKNRIKWPSAIRTDDPVYVQNHLQQLQAQPFPALSLYTYLEEMGVEDVEAEIDRIAIQLEDPRFHPDRMQSAVESMLAVQQSSMPEMVDAYGPPQAGAGGMSDEAFNANLEASAVPAKNELVKSR